MQDNWILDVLADLCDFARANHLEALASALERTSEVAMVELSAESVLLLGGGDQSAGSLGAHRREFPERPGP
jgi:hypothetical protein